MHTQMPQRIFRLLLLLVFVAAYSVAAYSQSNIQAHVIAGSPVTSERRSPLIPILTKYYNQQDGISVNELIKRALNSNQELTAARLEIDKAHSRLNQARLRPNPTLEIEQSSGAAIGSPGGGQFNVGASFPLEIYGRRAARIDQAQIAIEASRAEVRNRERLLVSGILTNYAEALTALHELEITERLLELDLQTASVVQIRVNEGDVAPLELNLLQAEVERLRARRQRAEGKLQASYTQLKTLSGIPFEDTFQLREKIDSAQLPVTPQTPEAAVTTAIASRPDVRLTQIEVQIATAGLRLIRAQSRPDLTLYTRYTQGRLGFDNLAETRYPSRDRTLAFGVAIVVPVFNKNQGAKAEAEIAVRQAQSRREYAERLVRGEILAAYQRLEAARRVVETLETRALPRTTENVETFRRVYEIGNITISELINEQRRLLDATRELSEALTERYRAQIDLNIALGAGSLLPEQK
jgi:outer membrane protein, heavy metal efflux system